MEFNVLDIGIMALTLISVLIGLYRGLWREMLTVVVWIIAGIVSYTHSKRMGVHLSFMGNAQSQQYTAAAVLFILVVIAGGIIKHFAFKSYNVGQPSGLDRTLGAAFGVARAYALIVLAMVVGDYTSVSDQNWFLDSSLIVKFEDSADAITGRVPQKWEKFVRHADDNSKHEVAPADSVEPVVPAPATPLEPVAPVITPTDAAAPETAPATPAAPMVPATAPANTN